MTTVLEINFTKKEILKNLRLLKLHPVQNKTLGITEMQMSFRVLSSVIIPHEIKTPKSKTAVAFVGPRVMNLSFRKLRPSVLQRQTRQDRNVTVILQSSA